MVHCFLGTPHHLAEFQGVSVASVVVIVMYLDQLKPRKSAGLSRCMTATRSGAAGIKIFPAYLVCTGGTVSCCDTVTAVPAGWEYQAQSHMLRSGGLEVGSH
jgi:hypothetical protein